MKNHENPENPEPVDPQPPLLEPSDRPLMSKSEYARWRGCSNSAITRAKKENRISIVVVNGKELVDQRASDLLWSGLTRPKADAPRPPSTADTDASADLDLGEAADYHSSKARIARADAELRELQLSRERGVVIARADVRKDLTDAAAIILAAMQGIPDRLAPLLVNQSDQARIRAIIADEIEQTLARISDALAGVLARSPEPAPEPIEQAS